MELPKKAWNNYVKQLSLINKTAADDIEKYIEQGIAKTPKDLVDYAYYVVRKYGNGSAALSATMYDALAAIEGANVPPATMADLPEYDEVAKSVYGTLKTSNNSKEIAGAASRLVKRTGADTMLINAQRDGAQFAWVPSGDTCAFCIALASRGWQYMSKSAMKNGHAEHIHSNCDCTYAVRFDNTTAVPGYKPEVYREMYAEAEGNTSKEKINAMRRKFYAENKGNISDNSSKAEELNVNSAERLKIALNNAYETHRISNNLNATPIDEMGELSPIKVDLGKLSQESKEVFSNTIASLIDEYDTTLQQVRTMNAEEAMLQYKNSFATVYHDYTVDQSVMLINPVKCKDYNGMIDRINELSENGYCVKISEDKANQYVATHEFAHTLINMQDELNNKTNWLNADYDSIRRARKEIEEIYDDYIKECGALEKQAKEYEKQYLNAALTSPLDELEQLSQQAREAYDVLDAMKLSDYSLTNSDEFMAESFANEKIGIVSTPHSRRVMEVIDKYFRR